MSVHYYAEYCLGRHGGPIRRTRSGVPALLSIGVDIFLNFVFGVVALVFQGAWFVLRTLVRFAALVLVTASTMAVAVLRFLIAVFELPMQALQPRPEPAHCRRVGKAAWSGSREV